jgi:FkbM family methyltransferase
MTDPEILLSKDGRTFDPQQIFDRKWLEPLEMRLLTDFAPHFDTFIDVGAHVGIYTIAISKLNGENIEVHSFEPDQINFRALNNAVHINNLKTRISLNNMAVADHVGELRFYLSTENPGDHRIAPAAEAREVVTVPCTSLDAYFRDKPLRNVLLKMDIQGAEYAAFKGFRETLGRITGDLVIAMEFWPYGLQLAGVAAEELIDLMEELGGSLFLIDEASFTIFPHDFDWLREYCRTVLTVESQWFANFLITRPSRALSDVTTRWINRGE